MEKTYLCAAMGKNFRYVPGEEFPWQYKYEHMAVTTDCVIFTYEEWKLKVLLVRRGGEPCKGMWAFPGGFLQNTETAEQGALRELREETALRPSSPIVQLGIFSDVDRDPRERVITIAWYALVKPSEVRGGDDAAEASWFPVDDLPPLAFDHAKIFQAAMERLRRDIHFQPVGFDLLDEEFTIPDLQRLYETVLGVKFDRRNFQRKILASGILEEAFPKDHIYYRMNPDPDFYCAPPDYKETSVCEESAAFPEEPPMAASPAESQARFFKARRGRIANFFRLNRDRYDQLKEEGKKLEF